MSHLPRQSISRYLTPQQGSTPPLIGRLKHLLKSKSKCNLQELKDMAQYLGFKNLSKYNTADMRALAKKVFKEHFLSSQSMKQTKEMAASFGIPKARSYVKKDQGKLLNKIFDEVYYSTRSPSRSRSKSPKARSPSRSPSRSGPTKSRASRSVFSFQAPPTTSLPVIQFPHSQVQSAYSGGKQYTKKELEQTSIKRVKQLAKDLGITGTYKYTSRNIESLIKKMLALQNGLSAPSSSRLHPPASALAPYTKAQMNLMSIKRIREIAKEVGLTRYSHYQSHNINELINRIVSHQKKYQLSRVSDRTTQPMSSVRVTPATQPILTPQRDEFRGGDNEFQGDVSSEESEEEEEKEEHIRRPSSEKRSSFLPPSISPPPDRESQQEQPSFLSAPSFSDEKTAPSDPFRHLRRTPVSSSSTSPYLDPLLLGIPQTRAEKQEQKQEEKLIVVEPPIQILEQAPQERRQDIDKIFKHVAEECASKFAEQFAELPNDVLVDNFPISATETPLFQQLTAPPSSSEPLELPPVVHIAPKVSATPSFIEPPTAQHLLPSPSSGPYLDASQLAPSLSRRSATPRISPTIASSQYFPIAEPSVPSSTTYLDSSLFAADSGPTPARSRAATMHVPTVSFEAPASIPRTSILRQPVFPSSPLVAELPPPQLTPEEKQEEKVLEQKHTEMLDTKHEEVKQKTDALQTVQAHLSKPLTDSELSLFDDMFGAGSSADDIVDKVKSLNEPEVKQKNEIDLGRILQIIKERFKVGSVTAIEKNRVQAWINEGLSENEILRKFKEMYVSDLTSEWKEKYSPVLLGDLLGVLVEMFNDKEIAKIFNQIILTLKTVDEKEKEFMKERFIELKNKIQNETFSTAKALDAYNYLRDDVESWLLNSLRDTNSLGVGFWKELDDKLRRVQSNIIRTSPKVWVAQDLQDMLDTIYYDMRGNPMPTQRPEDLFKLLTRREDRELEARMEHSLQDLHSEMYPGPPRTYRDLFDQVSA